MVSESLNRFIIAPCIMYVINIFEDD
jgi:hypothetical protein